jgi:hypothetical protein
MSAEVVWLLPSPSQEFESGPQISREFDALKIRYDFESEAGAYEWEEVTFTGVVAFRFTDAVHCSPEQIGAYDKLQIVTGSAWQSQLDGPPASHVNHYRIYFDDVGCYEVLSRGFVPPAQSSET